MKRNNKLDYPINENEQIKLANDKKRIELKEEKLRLKKEKLFNELEKVYCRLVRKDILTNIIDSTVTDVNISDFEYKIMIEKNLLAFLSNYCRKSIYDEKAYEYLEAYEILSNIICLFSERIKENNPLYSGKQIEDAIEEAFINYKGEKMFEDEVILYLRKS